MTGRGSVRGRRGGAPSRTAWFTLRGLAFAAIVACKARSPETDRLTLLMERDVEGLDPHASGQLWQTQTVLANLYEPLVTLDRELSLSPGLAASWSNPGESTWLFQLRDGVKFHTGTLLDPKDVVFSLLRARDHPRSAHRSALASITDVKALPENRVSITTRTPDASLASRLREVFVVSRRFVEEHGEAALETTSAGTGAYVLKAWIRGAKVEAERFPDYWRGAASIPRVAFSNSSWADVKEPPPLVVFESVPGSSGHERAARAAEARFHASLSITYLAFDLRTPAALSPKPGGNPFIDPGVRAAVALAVDRDALRRAGGVEGFVPTQLVPPHVFGFDPSLPAPARDIAAARRLLERSPFREGFDVDLDLRPSNAAFGPAIANALGEIGIRVHPRIAPADQQFFERLSKGESPLFVLRFSCRTGDAQELFDKWVHSRDPESGFGEANFSYDVNPVPGLDDEIDAARRELNPAVRLKALQAVMRRVMEARLAVPVLNEKDYVFVSPGIEWTPRIDSFRLVHEMTLKGR